MDEKLRQLLTLIGTNDELVDTTTGHGWGHEHWNFDTTADENFDPNTPFQLVLPAWAISYARQVLGIEDSEGIAEAKTNGA